MEITSRNVNDAVESTMYWIRGAGVKEQTRNGPVLVGLEPLLVTYERPDERVLFWPERDQNCIFTLMESIWMLAGRNDLKFVEYFNSNMKNFSDDGEVLPGAYGHRWRERFGRDQLPILIHHLKRNPETRRAVLTMWGVGSDLINIDHSKDVCCNTQAYFDLRGGRLNMTVTNRSNDLMWGMFGANAVHFSFLQEFVASAVGVSIGVYRQFTNNPHMYTELYGFSKHLDSPPMAMNHDAYLTGIKPRPIMDNDRWDVFLDDCEEFCENPFGEPTRYYHSFFPEVAYPMAMITKARKEKTGDGYYWAQRVAAEDWRLAVTEWIERREHARAA